MRTACALDSLNDVYVCTKNWSKFQKECKTLIIIIAKVRTEMDRQERSILTCCGHDTLVLSFLQLYGGSLTSLLLYLLDEVPLEA